jgi:hypothetical protein
MTELEQLSAELDQILFIHHSRCDQCGRSISVAVQANAWLVCQSCRVPCLVRPASNGNGYEAVYFNSGKAVRVIIKYDPTEKAN